MSNKSEVETLCEKLGLVPPLVKKWVEIYNSYRYKPGETICFYKVPGKAKQQGFLHYVSNKGNVYIWVNGEEVALPKKTRCCLWLDTYSRDFDPVKALKQELNRLKIPFGTSYCQLHGDGFLNFKLNDKEYSILIN